MKFYVENQTIRPDGIQPKIVSNSQDFVACKFRFGTSWAGLVKIALFAQGANTYTQLLDEDDCCMLPVEITAGQCGVSVYGADAGETTTATTNTYTLSVVQAGYYGEAVVPTPDLYSQLLAEINSAESSAEQSATEAAQSLSDAQDAQAGAEAAQIASETAQGEAEVAQEGAETAQAAAELAQDGAETAETGAQASETASAQALSDLLAMISSGDVPLLVDGKLPLAYIPATATTEVYVVTSEDDLTSLVAQRGDLAQLVEDIDGVSTITKSWQLLGDDATVAEDWVVWGTSYAVRAAYADTAGEASNANTINNKRIVGMTFDQFDSAVLDDDTFYFVYEDDADD